MIDEFLRPVKPDLINFASELDVFSIGRQLEFNSAVDEGSLVMITVHTDDNENDFDQLRREFYRLKSGNWHLKIYDLGELPHGATIEDTFFAFLKIQEELLKKNCKLIILGDNPMLAYWQYRALDSVCHQVNLSCIDNRFRLGDDSKELSAYNYLSKIITTEPHSLFDYHHFGHQTYFVAQEELDLMEELNFDVKRLGVLTESIEESEPEFRNSDLVVLNLESIQSSDFQSSPELSPNGFNSREICALSRYSGINNKTRSFGVYNFKAKNILTDNLLLSEILWYFIEGKNNSSVEIDFEDENGYESFHVQIPEQELLFYRDIKSDQWWLELNNPMEAESSGRQIIPCSHKDYKDSLKGKIPQRWWKAYKKLY